MTKRHGILLPLMGWLSGLVVVLALALWFVVAQSRHQLESYKAELERRGETFEVAKLTPPSPPKENNGADALVAATTELHTAIKAGKSKPFAPGQLEKKPGLAETVHRRQAAYRAKMDVPWDEFRTVIEPLQPGLAKVRLASKAPILIIEPGYSEGFAMQLPFTSPFLASCQFLAAENLLWLRDGQIPNAVENIETMLVMASITDRQINLISQLVTASIIQMASYSTWEILHSTASVGDLIRLQAAWNLIKPGANLLEAMRMERAWGIDAFASPDDTYFQITGGIPAADPETEKMFNTAATNVWKVLFRAGDEYWFLECNQSLLDSLEKKDWRAALGRSKGIQTSLESPSLSRKLSHLILQPLGGILEKMAATEATHHLCLTAVAIRRYQLDHHGKLPKNLAELIPSYLDVIPLDNMDGKPLRYQREGENFFLYAIGENGMDDGGNPETPTGKKRRGPTDGLDIVWPQAVPPASAGE